MEDCFYFVRVSFDAFGRDQTTKYLASCYSKDTFHRVELELGFPHIGKSSCQIRNVIEPSQK
jgi:hypothetical protein